MNDEEIQKLVHMNHRLNLVLGYAMSYIFCNHTPYGESDRAYRWLCEAVENMIYLDKPLPPLP